MKLNDNTNSDRSVRLEIFERGKAAVRRLHSNPYLCCTMVWYSTEYSTFLVKTRQEGKIITNVFINSISSIWIHLKKLCVSRIRQTTHCFWRLYLLKSGKWTSSVTEFITLWWYVRWCWRTPLSAAGV